jgi:hypothetical protein
MSADCHRKSAQHTTEEFNNFLLSHQVKTSPNESPTKSHRGFINKLVFDIKKLVKYHPNNEIKWMNEKPKNHRKAYEPTEVRSIFIDLFLK